VHTLPVTNEGALGPLQTLDPSQIPSDWHDVTPEWMTAAIGGRHPAAHVSDVALITIDNGTNRRARFGLRYDAGSGPDVVFAKAEGQYREVHAQNGNMFNEAELFASGVPLPVDHPLPYKVIIDRPALDYVIVMEDVTRRGADPRDATRPMTLDQVANGLRGLARLHSEYWGFSETTHPNLAWAQTFEATDGYGAPLVRSVPTGLARATGHVPDDVMALDAETMVSYLARFLRSLTRGPVTLLHADPHIGNTYVLPDNDVGFLDWQVARRGNWSHDVGYFVVSALTVDDRRRSEADLVEEYRKALEVPSDARPTPEDAWLRYRASAAYGLPVWLATMSSGSAQSTDVCLALCERYGAAFVELDAVGALESLGI
jgi:hypothetical protein